MLFDNDDGHGVRRHEFAHHAHQFLHDERRETLHRFIEQKQLRIDHQGAADREHLLLAPGKLVAVIAPALGQAREKSVHGIDVPVSRARDGCQVFFDRQ
jgi:hypothetical protein